MPGDRDTRTTCLSAVDSRTRCSTASRWLCPPCSRRQRDEEDEDDVCRLPDSVVVDHQNYFLLKQLTEEKRKKHKEVLKEMKKELTHLTQVCDSQVRTAVEELLASLKDLDLRLNLLMERNEQLDLLSKQEVHVLWEEVQEKLKMKKMRIMDLNHKLTECETQRASKVRVLLVKNVHLLENISFLPPPDVFRLIHTEATMLNLSLLMNRRCAARLTLLLLEENLQQEEQLRLQWEELLSCWRRSRATGVLDRYWTLCSSDEEQPLVSGQLVEQREETIHHICSLVPPSCSTTLASDWFNQLTVINQQIDDLHSEVLHQLRCRSHHRWSEHLARVELCEKELSALQLSDVEMNDVIGSQLLAVIGQGQSQDEQRLAAVDRCRDAVARRALHLSTCVFAVMRGAALLWETHSRRLERRRVRVEQRIQQQHTQGEKVHLCEQVSSEEALDETIGYLEDVKHSSTGCVSDQVEVLERLPFVLLEELLSYSSSLSSFFHLDHTYKPSPEELQNLHPYLHSFSTQMGQCEAQMKKPEKKMEASGPTHLSPDWLTEAGSSLQALSDMSSDVMFTSSRGVAYTGPAFRCTAPDLPDHLQLEMHLSPFPVELLTETLSRTRTLFLDHLEQHVKDVLSSAVTTVKERRKAAYWGRELQLKQLKIQHTQKQMYTPRLAELQLHTRLVKSHSEEVSNVLTSLRVEHQEHQAFLSERKQEVILNLSHVEAEAQRANSSTRLHALSSTLKGCLDQHIKDTQHLQTTFRQNVIVQLDRVKTRTAQLLSTFRLFREGGDFAPEELNSFQKKLKEETRRIRVTEESIYSELEEFESHNLKQLKETSEGLEEKLYSMRSELDFIEQIQDTMRKTRVQMKAEAASSKQQQIIISSKLEDLRKMMENTQVSTDQVCSLLSAVNEEFRKRCRYLDFPLVSSLSVLSVHESGQQVQSNSPPGLLQRRRTREDLLQDPLVEVIRSLNRSCEIQNAAAAEREERGESPAGQSPVQQKCTQPLRLRRDDKSIRTERKFQVFGPEPEENPHSFSSSLNSLLWRTNDVLLLVAEDFYRRERSVLSRFLRVPDRLDQWAESMQQRLLGYQDQMKKFLCMSREELDSQLCLLENLLLSLPAVLICNHEQRQEAELIEEVTEVRVKLEEKLSASEEEKSMNVKRLRVSLGEEELLSLSSREELRQQQLHSDICSLHLELQVCVKVRGEEFVTSLALLTEKLLSQLDELLLPEEAVQRSGVDTVTVATEEETGRKPCTVSRTRPGDPSPTNKDTDPPSGVTMATTTSVTTSRCTLGHQVIEQRDAAEKRLQQVLLLELSRSDEDKRRRLSELQSWNAHWRQQIHTLKQHTHTQAEM